jgi:hypothetical protein
MDRIAALTMRAAGLLSVLAQQGQPVDRAGQGRVIEVYPAAALPRWHLPHNKYKGAQHRKRSARSWTPCYWPYPDSTWATSTRYAGSQATRSMPSFVPSLPAPRGWV